MLHSIRRFSLAPPGVRATQERRPRTRIKVLLLKAMLLGPPLANDQFAISSNTPPCQVAGPCRVAVGMSGRNDPGFSITGWDAAGKFYSDCGLFCDYAGFFTRSNTPKINVTTL